MADRDPIKNAVKLVGEFVVVPGTSQWLDGNIRSGVAHTVAGWAAYALIGPVGAVLVAVNSFSSSVSDQASVSDQPVEGNATLDS